MQEQVPVSSHSGISRPDVLTSVVDSQSGESKAQRYRQSIEQVYRDLDSSLKDPEVQAMALTLIKEVVPEFEKLPYTARLALLRSKVPDAIVALEELRRRQAEQKRIQEERQRAEAENTRRQREEEERGVLVYRLHELLLKESGLGLTPELMNQMLEFLNQPPSPEQYADFRQKIYQASKMLDERFFLVNNLITPFSINMMNHNRLMLEQQVKSMEQRIQVLEEPRETMTSVGDSSVNDSSSLALSSRASSTAPSNHSSKRSHKNLRQSTIDPRLNDDPFAQDDAEYARARKKADALSKAPLTQL